MGKEWLHKVPGTDTPVCNEFDPIMHSGRTNICTHCGHWEDEHGDE